MAVVDVKLEKLSEVSMRDFSTFGRIIGRDEDTEEGKYELHPVDAKPAVENNMIKAYWDLIPFKDNKEDRFSMGMLFVYPKPIGEIVNWTEVHYETYEFFFPLGGKQFIFVLAPKSKIPEAEKTRAFLIGPNEGVLLNKGTWHYPPFAIDGPTPVLMPRFGKLGEVTGDVTEAFGKKWETPVGNRYFKGQLHALKTDYYGEGYGGEYKIRIIL
ncbi:MAG: hypothetical protein PWQ24_1850 [Mesotoga sp.]|nr:hypothetical protein [Mesotoga sp.]